MVKDIGYLSELLDDSPIGIFIVDEDTNIIMCNDYLFKMFGILPKDYVGKRFGNVFKCFNKEKRGLLCGTSLKYSGIQFDPSLVETFISNVLTKNYDFNITNTSLSEVNLEI